MSDREKVINELVEHIESALSVDSDYVDCVRTDLLQYTVAMLKEQKGLLLALEQSNAVNGFLNAEVERLNGLLREQEDIIKQYHKADTFLYAHGWSWKGR